MGSPPKGQPKTPSPQKRTIASKGHSTPKWATVDDLIGYTFKDQLTTLQVELMMKNALDYFENTKSNPKNPWNEDTPSHRKPSVYYKQGHATLQYNYKNLTTNLGWTKSGSWVWTFFGTVPLNKAKVIHDPTDPRTQSRQGSAGSSAGKATPQASVDTRWRADYGDELMRDFGSFCWSDDLRTRTEWSDGKPVGKGWRGLAPSVLLKAPNPDPMLLEIWKRSDGTFHGHYSRNAFVRVTDRDLKASLHQFATEWIATLDGARKLI